MGESYFWKPFAQGVATPIVLIGGTNLLLKDFKVSNPYLYWGGLAASSAVVVGILADKIKVPILNAESNRLTDEELLKVARMDIDNHIDNGTFYVLGEEPQAFHDGELDGENFYTIVSLYSQHHEDEDKAETILKNMFKKEYPQYLGDESFNADYTKGYTDITEKIQHKDKYGQPKETMVQSLKGYAGNCPSCDKRINFPVSGGGLYCYDCQVYLRPSKGKGMNKTLEYDAE